MGQRVQDASAEAKERATSQADTGDAESGDYSFSQAIVAISDRIMVLMLAT